MTENSYWWTTSGTPSGHQVASYDQADLSQIVALLSGAMGWEGVIPDYLNDLGYTIPGANTFRVLTGGAIVDGKPYISDANVDVTIPSTSSDERIDRVVLRASWSGYTVQITRIAGSESATPSAPAITQTSGTTYDIMLYQVRVNSSGTVTLEADERVWADVPEGHIANAMLRDSLATSVLGRSANSGGTPADIQATVNDRVLARQSNALSWVQIATDMIADAAVTGPKLGEGVLGITSRQGGASTNWQTAGTSEYSPGDVKIYIGSSIWSGSSATSGSKQVNYQAAFSYQPIVFATIFYNPGDVYSVVVNSANTDYFIWYWKSNPAVTQAQIVWLAIGPA